MTKFFCALLSATFLVGCSTVDNHNTTTQINVVPTVAAPHPPTPPVAVTLGSVLSCDGEGRLVSTPGPQLAVRYRNETNAPVSIYWLSQNGERQSFGVVDPGKSLQRPGSQTSFWLVADQHQQCIGIVHPGATTSTIMVRPTASNALKDELIAVANAAEVVPSNTERRLSFNTSLTENCSVVSPVVGRIVEQPAHGNAGLRDVSSYPNYPAANPRHACNKQAVAGLELWYKAGNGYVGDDTLSVDYFFPDGREQYVTYLLTVR